MKDFPWNFIGKGLVVLLSLVGKSWSLCPNWCSQHGICSGTTEDATCTCEYGYTGDGCEVRLCPWGYDPLSEGQNSRVIRVITTAVAGELEGRWTLSFQGETVEIDANAKEVDGKRCSAVVSELLNIESATCIRGDIDSHLGTTYTISLKEWPLHPMINNIYTHDGNPPIKAFSCSMHQVQGLACENMSDAEDVAVHVAEGPFFTASVLKLHASARNPSPDFRFIEAFAREEPIFTLDGLGHLKTSGKLSTSDSLSVDRGADISQSLIVTTDDLTCSNSSSPAVNVTVHRAHSPGLDIDDKDTILQISTDVGPVFTIGPGGTMIDAPGGLQIQNGGLEIDAGDVNIVEGMLRVGEGGSIISGPTSISVKDTSVASALSMKGGVSSGVHPLLELSLDGEPERQGRGETAFLSASAGGVERLTIAASGHTTVHTGGLQVESGGVTVNAGGLAVESGGAMVEGGITIASGPLRLLGEQGMIVESGGFVVTHDSTSQSALKVTSSADGFGGSVARIEAPGKKGAGGFKLLEGVAGDETVFSLSGEGDLSLDGSAKVSGKISVEGGFNLSGSAAFVPGEVPAGDMIVLNATRSTFWNIVSDGVSGPKNEVQIEGELLPDQFMVIMNSDEQHLSFGLGDGEVINIPSGFTVMLVYNGIHWTDLRSLHAEVTELRGVATLEAASDLDMGNVTLSVGRIVSKSHTQPGESTSEGQVAVFWNGGLLHGTPALSVDPITATLSVERLKAKSVTGGLDFRGSRASNVALHNATIVDGVPYIAIDQLILRSASENLSPAIQKNPRFAVINERGKFSALDRDVMGFASDGVPSVSALSVGGLNAHHLTSPLNGNGETVRNIALQDVTALTGLKHLEVGELSVNTLAANNDVEDNTWSVLIASEGGLVTAAPNEGLRISSSGQVVVGQEGMRFEGVLDLTGVEVQWPVDVAEALDVISGQVKTQNGAGGKENNLNEPPSDVSASDITVEGDVKLLRQVDSKGRLTAFGTDGSLVPAEMFADSMESLLAIHKRSMNTTTYSFEPSSKCITGQLCFNLSKTDLYFINEGEVTATSVQVAGRLSVSELSLGGNVQVGGFALEDAVVEKARKITVSGDFRMEPFDTDEGRGSLLGVGQGGRLEMTEGMSWRKDKWGGAELRVQSISGHAVNGNIDMRGHTIFGGSIDLDTEGKLEGIVVAGSVTGGGPYMDSSDERLKEDIHELDSKEAWQKVLALRGEVEEVVPEVVSQGDDGYLSIAYGHLVPITVEALKHSNKLLKQEESKRISDIQKLVVENELLKKDIEGLRDRVDSLERLLLKALKPQGSTRTSSS